MKLLVIFVLIGVAAADSRVCKDSKTLLKCYNNYFDNLKIPIAKFPAYNDYLKVFIDYNTPSKLNDLCVFVKTLESCLKDIENECVSPDGFQQLIGNGEDMYDYPTNYGIIQYTCGDGLQAWNKIINCTTQNGQAINDANNECEATFVNTTRGCPEEVTFLECTYVLLKKDCGQDAYNFACSADSNGMKYSTPDCLQNMIHCDAISESTGSTMKGMSNTDSTVSSTVSSSTSSDPGSGAERKEFRFITLFSAVIFILQISKL